MLIVLVVSSGAIAVATARFCLTSFAKSGFDSLLYHYRARYCNVQSRNAGKNEIIGNAKMEMQPFERLSGPVDPGRHNQQKLCTSPTNRRTNPVTVLHHTLIVMTTRRTNVTHRVALLLWHR